MRCFRALYKVCSDKAIVPNSLRIPLCYDRRGFPLYCGGFADVWKGKHNGQDVAVKAIRAPSPEGLRKVTGVCHRTCGLFTRRCADQPNQRLCKEVVSWSALRHPNVLPLLGVTMNDSHFAMVSEWMENRNINEFVEANPDANRLELVSFPFKVSDHCSILRII